MILLWRELKNCRDYTPRHVDGIFGEILINSRIEFAHNASLHTMLNKKCSYISLLTNPFYSTACHLNFYEYREFNCSDIRNLNLLFSLDIPSI